VPVADSCIRSRLVKRWKVVPENWDVEVNEWTTEVRERSVTVMKKVPRIKEQTRIYCVTKMVPQTRTKAESVCACEMAAETKTESYVLRVTRTVTKQECVEVRKCVEEEVPADEAYGSGAGGGKGDLCGGGCKQGGSSILPPPGDDPGRRVKTEAGPDVRASGPPRFSGGDSREDEKSGSRPDRPGFFARSIDS
jgi:hypothetical protein